MSNIERRTRFVGVRLTEDEYRQVVELAGLEQRSISSIVRRAVVSRLEETKS